MRITFLGSGTSQGVPMIACKCNVCLSSNPKDQRLRSSILIEKGTHTLVIDSGPDFRTQMLRANVQHLDAILLTHAHRDHIAGLDDTRAFISQSQKAFDIYAEPIVIKELKQIFAYAFKAKKYPGVPEFVLHKITERENFYVADICVTPIRGIHYKLPVLGFRIADFTYFTDINAIPDAEFEALKGTRYFVINALRKTPHLSHYSLNEALEVIRRVQPEYAFLTHISHQMGLHDEVQKQLPEHVFLAYDGLTIDI